MLMEAETWVALAFVLFVGLLGYLGVHRVITKSLDDRAARIKAELDEARKLKDEAAELLAEYQRKRQAAEGEAQDIISGAKAEAERMAAEAKVRIEDFVARLQGHREFHIFANVGFHAVAEHRHGVLLHGSKQQNFRQCRMLIQLARFAGDVRGLVGDAFEIRAQFHRRNHPAKIGRHRLKT